MDNGNTKRKVNQPCQHCGISREDGKFKAAQSLFCNEQVCQEVRMVYVKERQKQSHLHKQQLEKVNKVVDGKTKSGRICASCGGDPHPNYRLCPSCHRRQKSVNV